MKYTAKEDRALIEFLRSSLSENNSYDITHNEDGVVFSLRNNSIFVTASIKGEDICKSNIISLNIEKDGETISLSVYAGVGKLYEELLTFIGVIQDKKISRKFFNLYNQ